jgi:NAD(P)-dependent dehydrogenase (short-subunit alcohol dehydrogenase family)
MQEFRDRVAVITGAASGIGRALTQRCAQEGMKVVLADVEETALVEALAEVQATGVQALAIVTDVSSARSVEALAQQTLDRFGAVHLLCNNAGVGAGTTIWDTPLADWEWVLGVNLWGVIYGVRTFVPIMLRQDTACHIVNTASITGVTAGPGFGIYKVAKHGVVTLSETLYYELAQRQAKVKVSVLCPAIVNTRILDSERNRPVEHQVNPSPISAEDEMMIQAMRQAVQQAMSPDQVAEQVFTAIQDEQLYIFTHQETKEWIRARTEEMLSGQNPPLTANYL